MVCNKYLFSLDEETEPQTSEKFTQVHLNSNWDNARSESTRVYLTIQSVQGPTLPHQGMDSRSSLMEGGMVSRPLLGEGGGIIMSMPGGLQEVVGIKR